VPIVAAVSIFSRKGSERLSPYPGPPRLLFFRPHGSWCSVATPLIRRSSTGGAANRQMGERPCPRGRTRIRPPQRSPPPRRPPKRRRKRSRKKDVSPRRRREGARLGERADGDETNDRGNGPEALLGQYRGTAPSATLYSALSSFGRRTPA
jgi:hypothetical protein